MRKKTKIITGIGIVIVLISALFLLLQSGPNNNSNDEKLEISFRLKWKYNGTSCGAMLANSNGFFDEEKLSVKIEQGGFEWDSKKMVASGRDQIGLTGADELILAIENGMPLIAIGADFQRTPCCIFSLKSTAIEKPKDFPNKRLGIRKSMNTEFQYISLMKHNQIDRTTVHEEPIKFDLTRVREGHLDMWTSYLTMAPIEAKGLEVNTIKFSDYGVKSYGNVIFTTRDFAKENPEVLRSFLKAYYRGWQWGIDNPSKAGGIIKKFNPEADIEIENKIFALAIPLLKTDNGKKMGLMNNDMWVSTMQVLIDTGKLKTELDVDKIYTNEFLSEK